MVWQRFVRGCIPIAVYWKELAAFLLSVASVCAVTIIAVLLWKALTEKTIAIAPISVPEVMAKNGYTADVAAQRLRDVLNKFVEGANKGKNGPNVALQADLPSIVVPTIGLSLETIAADIRTFLHIARRSNISGEVTIAQKQLWLRLRINGRDFFTSTNGVDPERPDDLLAPAAEEFFELTDPYIAAVALSGSDPGKSLEIARRIIAERYEPDSSVTWVRILVGYVQKIARWFRVETDPSVSLAHNLIGYILTNQGTTEGAIAEYNEAIKLDPRNAMAHNNLGVALSNQGKTVGAIAEYNEAVRLDRRFATAHNNLGVARSDQTTDAIFEYKTAIELDPRLAPPHTNLGYALSNRGTTKDEIAEYKKEAIAEYKTAIELDPNLVQPHIFLGEALRDQHETEAAIAEDRTAIGLDPYNALAHNNLGLALSGQGKTEEAIAEYRKAIMLNPQLADPHHYLAIILRAQENTKEADDEDRKAADLGPKPPPKHPD